MQYRFCMGVGFPLVNRADFCVSLQPKVQLLPFLYVFHPLMPTLRLVKPQILSSARKRNHLRQSRCIHDHNIRYHVVDHDKRGTKDTRLLRDAIAAESADKAQLTSRENNPLRSISPPKTPFSIRRVYPKDARPVAKRELVFLEDLAKGDVKKRADRNDRAKGDHEKPTTEKIAPVSTRKPSLLEELFPEDVKKAEKGKKQEEVGHDDVPRVPPLNLDGLLKDFETGIDTPQVQTQQKLRTREAMLDAFRQQKLTVLVLSRASKSLAESDFRRVAPKGMHIEEWRGPGDILKGKTDRHRYSP